MEGFLVSDQAAEEAKVAKSKLHQMIVDGSPKPCMLGERVPGPREGA
jgi:hypothetical protein